MTTARPAATPSAGSMTATTDAAPTVSSAVVADGDGQAGMLMAGTGTLLPMADATKIGSDGDLSAYSGTAAKTTSIAVQSVPADEGFWVGSDASDRVWVQLTGAAGESPFTVKKGDAVAFTGKVVANASGFADQAGVTDAEGKKLLTAQGQHIAVVRKALQLAK